MGNTKTVSSSSRQKVHKLDEPNNKRKKPKKHKKLRLAMKIFFLVLLLGILAGLIVFYVKYGDQLLKWKNEAHELIQESTLDTFRASETSIIYASNKSVIAKLKSEKDSYYLTFDEIPQYAKDAMIACEDREFLEHEGVNLMSTFKAAALLVKSKLKGEGITRGGSTITQQVAKLVFLTNAQTYERKIKEIFIAFEMEKKYSKNQIMEFYMNNIYFSNGYYGIEAASRGYFNKPASELDLSEIAFLCAIPNSPNRYDPLEHFSNTIERRDRILKQMMEAEFITAAEYTDASYEDIILNPAEAIKTQNYLTTFSIRCATKALMKAQGFEFKYKFKNSEEEEEYNERYDEMYSECNKSLYTGGYRIYTSLNKKKQKALQKAVDEQLAVFTEKTEKDKVYTLQGAATCIDNETGFVVAMIGGRKQKSITGYTLNRGFQSFRQPGSSFKPLVVYTPQLERNYTPDSIVDDSYFEGGPRNSDGSYSGNIPLRYAVEKSKNVIAWKLFEELTPKVGLSYVTKMNFSKIESSDYYPAASLGGLTTGASTLEMASGYATIENDGVFRDPTCITKITDSEGNVIVNNKKIREERQVYEENAARMMTDILTGVLQRGTAAGHALDNGMACAGKTGTTSDKKDGWFCGFTPYYTTAVWVGCDNPKTVDNLYGSTYPLSIWEQYMNEIHSGLELKEFEPYEGKNDSSYYNDENEPAETLNPDEVIDPDTVEPEETAKPEEKTPEPQQTTDEPADIPDEPTDIPDEPADIPDDEEEIPLEPEEPEDVGQDEPEENIGDTGEENLEE